MDQHWQEFRPCDPWGAPVKWLKLAVAAAVVALCVILLAGMKDIRRFLRMRRM